MLLFLLLLENDVSTRQTMEIDAYLHHCQTDPCFICEIVTGYPEEQYRVIYENESIIVFLNKYPTLYGYTLVAPKEHCENSIEDFTITEYLSLQITIYWVAQAVKQEVPTERIYILTLGSRQGISHVHWHIAPLPPNVPYKEQQLEALNFKKGILKLSKEEMTSLAKRIRSRMEDTKNLLF